MWIRVNDRRVFTGLLGALIAMCWLALAVWSISPYAPYLNHEILEDFPFALSHEYILLLLVFVIGWTLMTFAMMLPTSLPLIALFRRLTLSHPDRAQLVLLVIAGYLLVWMLFGALAHLGDLLVHEMVHRSARLEANGWMISATILVVAGLYQFTPLKYACLDKCRSPLSFVIEHWQGRRERRQSLWLGVHHGLYCLGCCWSLMLLMFAVGVGNLAWMFLLGTLMAVEKNMPWGRKLSAPLGVILLAWGVVVAVGAVWGWR